MLFFLACSSAGSGLRPSLPASFDSSSSGADSSDSGLSESTSFVESSSPDSALGDTGGFSLDSSDTGLISFPSGCGEFSLPWPAPIVAYGDSPYELEVIDLCFTPEGVSGVLSRVLWDSWYQSGVICVVSATVSSDGSRVQVPGESVDAWHVTVSPEVVTLGSCDLPLYEVEHERYFGLDLSFSLWTSSGYSWSSFQSGSYSYVYDVSEVEPGVFDLDVDYF